MNHHRSNISCKKLTPISIHFNSTAHCINDFSVIPIEICCKADKSTRLKREYYWQLKLGTIFPKGLNNFPINDKRLISKPNINTAVDFEILTNLKAMEIDSDI